MAAGSSAFRNAEPRRAHRERSQPSARKHLGLLEKHKDYVLRAKDYHRKEDSLRRLKEKASLRNPDEFYFRMQNAKVVRGLHRDGEKTPKDGKVDGKSMLKMKTHDLTYLTMKSRQEEGKIDQLRGSLHLLQHQNNDEIPANRHKLFVKSRKAMESFDAAEHFGVHESMVNRAFNRVQKEKLASTTTPTLSRKSRNQSTRERTRRYEELAERLDRQETVKRLVEEVTVHKALMGKGKRRKDGEGRYRWKPERKK